MNTIRIPVLLLLTLCQVSASDFKWANFTDCIYLDYRYEKMELICDTHNYNGQYAKDEYCHSSLYRDLDVGSWNLNRTSKITSIRMGRCLIKYWDFVRLPNLQYPQFTYAFRNLEEIDISSIGLDQDNFPVIPPKFFIMKLNVSHNNITELNKKTSIRAVLLREIDFSYNRIVELNDLSNISSQLVTVNFSHNDIHYVEWNTFGNLTELKSVDLSYNFIRVLPDDIFQNNTKLEVLNLEMCQLTRLWCTECFKNLIHLNVAHNFIALTRELIEQLGTKVEVLDLTSNYLPVAHFSLFEKCHNLQFLNLSNTHIRHIYTDSLKTEWNLRTLDLSNNFFTEIELRSRGTFKNVKILYLNGNNLTGVNELQFENLPRLERLNISNNTIPCSYLKEFLKHRKYYTFDGNPQHQKDENCNVCRSKAEIKATQDAEDIINSD